jgi:hypothetical protein
MKNTHDDDRLIKVIRERLSGYTDEPDDKVWGTIFQASRAKRSAGFKLRYLSIALMIITSGQLLITSNRLKMMNQSVSESGQIYNNRPQFLSNINKAEGENREVSKKETFLNTNKNRITNDDVTRQEEYNAVSVTQEEENPDEQTLRNEHVTVNNEPIYESDSIDTKSDRDSSIQTAIKVTDKATSKKEEPEKKKKKMSMRLYALSGPVLNYYDVNPSKEDELIVTRLMSPSVLSAERLGFNINAGWQASLSDLWEIYSGVSYYSQNQKITFQYHSPDVMKAEQISGSSYRITPVDQQRSFEYAMKNVGVQLGGIYKLKGEKLKQKVGFGLSYEHGLSKRKTDNGYDNSKSDYFKYQLFYRSEYVINSQMSFIIQPSFTRSFLSREVLNEPLRMKPYHVQINVGVVYQFFKFKN